MRDLTRVTEFSTYNFKKSALWAGFSGLADWSDAECMERGSHNRETSDYESIQRIIDGKHPRGEFSVFPSSELGVAQRKNPGKKKHRSEAEKKEVRALRVAENIRSDPFRIINTFSLAHRNRDFFRVVAVNLESLYRANLKAEQRILFNRGSQPVDRYTFDRVISLARKVIAVWSKDNGATPEKTVLGLIKSGIQLMEESDCISGLASRKICPTCMISHLLHTAVPELPGRGKKYHHYANDSLISRLEEMARQKKWGGWLEVAAELHNREMHSKNGNIDSLKSVINEGSRLRRMARSRRVL